MESTSTAAPEKPKAKPAKPGQGKGSRRKLRNTDLQIQDLLNQGCLLDSEPTNELTISRMKFIQARLKTLEAIQAREQKIQRVEELTAENERLKQELEQALATQVPVQVTQSETPGAVNDAVNDAVNESVAQKLAQIRGRIIPEDHPQELVIEPLPLTPEELALEAERKAELERKQQKLVEARKLQAELEHQEKLAAVKAEIAAVEEANAQKISQLGSTTGYTPMTTDAMVGYRPQHLRRLP